MSADDVSQIKIGGHRVGVIGLIKAIEALASTENPLADNEAQAMLLEQLSKKNYISDNVRDQYAKAFLIAYKKHLGLPLEETDDFSGLEIKILGQGCARCDHLEQLVFSVVSELNLGADVEHVRDIVEIGKYGIMGTPGLVINGKVKAVGRIPEKQQIISWLKEEK